MGVFLMAIGKAAQSVKSGVGHPLFKQFKILWGFAGIAHDQGGAYGHIGNTFFTGVEQGVGFCKGGSAAHGF